MAHHGFEDLGFEALALLYLFWGVGSLLASGFVRKVGYKWCMIIGGISNTAWIFGGLLPIYHAENPNSDSFYL
jgi:hypothetical protein